MATGSPRSELVQADDEESTGEQLRALVSPEPKAKAVKSKKGGTAAPQLTVPTETFVAEQLSSRSKVTFTPEVLKSSGPPSGPPETWGFAGADAAPIPKAAPQAQGSRMATVLTKKKKKSKVNFDSEDSQTRKELSQSAPAKLKRVSIHETYTSQVEQEKKILDWSRLNSRDTTNLFASQDRIHDALHGMYYATPTKMDLDQRLARAGLKSPRSQLHKILEVAISCKDLQKRGSGLEPDPLCKVFCKGVLSKRWMEVFCTDWRTREQSPTFAKILRIGVPDNCGPVRFVVYDRDHKKRNSDMVQIGMLECSLQHEVLDACSGSSHFTAALRDIPLDAAESSEEAGASREEEGADGGRECGVMSLKVDVLHDPAILSVRLRMGLDFPGCRPPDMSTQMSSQQKYVPKFQRALQQLNVLAMDLFEQFHLIDARGDVLPKDKVVKGLSPEQFFNLLIYAGVLQGVQAVLSGAAVSSVLDWDGRIGTVGIEEARNIHRSVLVKPKKDGTQGDVLSRDMFGECIRRVSALLQEKHDKAREAAIKNGEAADSRPSTAGVGAMGRGQSHPFVQPHPPPDHSPLAAIQSRGRTPRLSKTTTGGGGNATLRTPMGTFRRLSSRRAGRESLRTRLGIVDGEGYPSGSLTARPSTQRSNSDTVALGTPRPLTSRSQSWGRGALEPLESTPEMPRGSGEAGARKGGGGGMQGNARAGTLKVREFGKLLEVAAWSPDEHIQRQAAPAIAALALSSGSNSRVVQSFGAVKVMMDMFASSEIAQVKADCMDAISQMVRSNVAACRQFVQEGGLDLTLRSTREDVTVRRRCLQVLESVLVESEADLGDRYSHPILLGLCGLIACPPQDLQEKAARLLVRMTKNATAKAQVWEPLRELDFEEEWVVSEGIESEKKKRNAIRALCKLLATSKHQYNDLTKPALYQSKLYDSNDYSSASSHSVGNALLDFFWCLEAPSNDSHKQCVGLFVAQGLCEVLAKRLARRTDCHLMEEDLTCLRCLTRLVTAVTEHVGVDGVMPPEAQETAREIVQRRGTVPFKWMTPEQMASMAETARYRYLAANETVVRQGEDGTSCFLVLSGSIKVLRRIRSETHELAVLKRGDEYGSASLLLQQARSATLVCSTPCEIMELSTSDLICVAREEDSLLLFGQILEYMSVNSSESFAVPRVEIQRSMGRKAMASLAVAQERIKQVLLESVSSMGKFEEPLKRDLEVQNLSCVLAHTTASRTPYALQVWNAGLPIPILSLTSSPEASVARRACEVVAALCHSKQVCEAMAPFPTRRRRSQEPSSGTSSPRIGGSAASSPLAAMTSHASTPQGSDPNPPELPALLIDCVIRGLSMQGDVSLLSALASLLLHPAVRPLVLSRCPPLQLLPVIQGAAPVTDAPVRGSSTSSTQPTTATDGPSPADTPEQILYTIRALLGLGEEKEGRLLIQSVSVTGWLEERVTRMESSDREVLQAYHRFLALVNSDPSTPMGNAKSKFLFRNAGIFMSANQRMFPRTDEGSSGEEGTKSGELSTWAQQQPEMKPLEDVDEKTQAKELLAQKKKQIGRLMQMAQKQAEEEWQSNVQWVMLGKKAQRQQRPSLSQLERLQTSALQDVPRTQDNQVGVHQAILGMQESDIAEMSAEMAPFIRKVQAAVASFDMWEHQRQKEMALKKELEDKNKKKYKGPDLTSAIKARRQRAVAQLKGNKTGPGTSSDSDTGKSPRASDGEGPGGKHTVSSPNAPQSPAGGPSDLALGGKLPPASTAEGGNLNSKEGSQVWDAVVSVSVGAAASPMAKASAERQPSDADNDMWKYGTILAEAAQAMLRLHKSKTSQMPKAKFRAAARAALCIDRICRRGSPAFLQASHVLLRIEAENKAKAAGIPH